MNKEINDLIELRKLISDDVHNKEFIVRYNYALFALEEDKKALVTFNLAIIDTLEMFADNNNKSFHDLLDAMTLMQKNRYKVSK